MKHFTIRRFELASLARWGCVSGLLTALIPGLCSGWIVFTLLRAARTTVESWRNASIELPLIGSIPINFIDVLKLQPFLDNLRSLDALGFFGILLFTLAFGLLGGLFVALNLFVIGLIYNAVSRVAGGIGIEIEE